MPELHSETIQTEQQVQEKTEESARREKLSRIKAELTQITARLWEDREFEPLPRVDFKVVIRPANIAISTSFSMPFAMVEHLFEEESEKCLKDLRRRYPDRPLIMEFLLYPYEYGGKKMKADSVFYPPLTVAENAACENQQTSGSSGEPVSKARKETRKKVKKGISGVLASTGTSEISPTFASDPISIDMEQWLRFSNKGVLRRVKKTLDVNKINTPQDLITMLGTNNPSETEWEEFVHKLDSSIAPNWLGAVGSQALYDWLRINGLFQP